MKKSEIILTTVSLPLDFLMLILAGFLAYFLRFSSFFVRIKPVIFNLSFQVYWPLMVAVAVGWLILFIVSGLYSVNANRRLLAELARVFFACSTGLAAITIFIFFRGELFNSRFIVLAGWALAVVLVSGERIILRIIKNVLYRAGAGVRKIVIVGEGHVAQILRQTLTERRGFGYVVVGQFSHFDEEAKKQIERLAQAGNADQILLTNPKSDEAEALAIIDFCEANHLNFKFSADLFSTYVTNMEVTAIAGIPIVEWQKTRLQAWGRVIKRLVDLVGAVILIILTGPLLLITALAVWLESGRPIIYKNERVGVKDKHFFVYKFRSMKREFCTGPQFGDNVQASEKENELIATQNSKQGPVYKIKDDPRVTKVGRIIRRASLDELPQFFNVLKGEMSLVGPR
ncbi:MAG: sugar transferase, partial [Patescibacteria group bacterium]